MTPNPVPNAVPETGSADLPASIEAIPDELAAIDDLPLAEHAEVYTRIHGALAGALAGTDPRTAAGPSGAPGRER